MTGHAAQTERAAQAEGAAASAAGALIITAMEGVETTAAELAQRMGFSVEIAATRATALRLLERRSYAVVVLDQNLADTDREGADLVWKHAGLAIPLQMNFALAGSVRLEREVRAALGRRQREQQKASLAAAAAVDTALKNAVTGFLLESRLALDEEGLPPRVEDRLRVLAGIADQLRAQLGPKVPADPTAGSLPLPRE